MRKISKHPYILQMQKKIYLKSQKKKLKFIDLNYNFYTSKRYFQTKTHNFRFKNYDIFIFSIINVEKSH